MNKNPLKPPRRTKRTPRPWFHSASKQLRDHFKRIYNQFVADYRVASALFRSGQWAKAEFPAFAFRPPVQLRV